LWRLRHPAGLSGGIGVLERICFTTVKCSEQNALFMAAIYPDLLVRADLATALRARRAGLRRGNTPADNAMVAKLTGRELEVLRWVAQGKRNREIAAIMNISPRTIQKHVQSILVKLCVETRGAAAAVWFEEMIRQK
jgi:DNA-binding NarL/FixJ family response regulator